MGHITDYKLKDKRFRKTEEAIIVAFFTSAEILSPERLVRVAGISRATLYRHHGNVTRVAPNYEQYILHKCEHTMQHFMHLRGGHIRSLYQRILIFLFTDKKIMQFLLEYGSRDFIEKIILAISPKIIATGKITEGEMLRVYVKEVAAVIEEWGRTGFDRDKIVALTDKIMYLTNTARERLGPLASFDAPKS